MSIKTNTNNPQPTNWFRKIVTGSSRIINYLLWELPVTILRNPVDGCGSVFCLVSVMATPSVVGFMGLAL